jgi:hypothetical protein
VYRQLEATIQSVHHSQFMRSSFTQSLYKTTSFHSFGLQSLFAQVIHVRFASN